MTSEKYSQTSPGQTPSMVSDAVATWFDDVFRIYGEVVDSQRRLAVALIHASSPVLDVGERASDKAAAGAESLSASVQARRQTPARAAAPTPVAPPSEGSSGDDEALAASRDDVAGRDGDTTQRGEDSSGDVDPGDEEIAGVTASEAEAAGPEEADAAVPTGAGDDETNAEAIAELDGDAPVDDDTSAETDIETDTETAEVAAAPVDIDVPGETDTDTGTADDGARGDAGEPERTSRRTNGAGDANGSERRRATGTRKASGASRPARRTTSSASGGRGTAR
ncbi:hypothetical protein [Actinomycetospora chibensis]|uniref:Uncharacterized protein n=1 Tax=Actinomycetospora chibensis TaxID=663606 RepID=A0ABV9RD49_9PSEU|nr:hypothetical protein [Actinomycetospora chibensis]MDD7923947.1 hypothetical protein [Actinomycetospora chibensis]